MQMIKEYEAEIVDIITETPETKTFIFKIQEKMEFKPGQFVMVTKEIPGKGIVSRPYSISSSPLDENIELTIKKYELGVFSSYICDNAKIGDKYKIKGPYGTFVLDENAESIVLIAAGSGIAPFRSMWRCILQKKLPIETIIIFSSKTIEQTIFYRELKTLNNNGIKFVLTLTRNQDPSWKGYSRRIDKDMIKESVEDVKGKLFYLCGPPEMCKATIQELKELGVEEKMIKTEIYH